MTVLLVRHGETASNANRIVQTPETPLNARGRRQAELLAERIRREGWQIERLLTSDLARAHETALVIGRRCGARVEIDEGLRERDFGDLRGRAYSDIGVDIMAPLYEPPAGESWPVFRQRVGATFERLAPSWSGLSPPRCHILVAHGLVCRAMVEDHLSAEGDLPPHWTNSSITAFEGQPPFTVSLLDDASHTEDDDGEEFTSQAGPV